MFPSILSYLSEKLVKTVHYALCVCFPHHRGSLLHACSRYFFSQSIHARRQVRRSGFTLCSFSLPFSYFLSQPQMLHIQHIRECTSLPSPIFVSYLSLSTCHSNDTAADRSTPPTKSSLPTILIFCIVAAAGMSFLELYSLKTCDLTLLPSFPPAVLRKTNKQTTNSILHRHRHNPALLLQPPKA